MIIIDDRNKKIRLGITLSYFLRYAFSSPITCSISRVGTSKPEAAINAETAQVSVDSAGVVTVESVLVHRTFCQVMLTNFPYDSQVCNVSVNCPGYSKFVPGIAENLEWSLSPQWIVSDVSIGAFYAHSPLDHKGATFFDIVITLDRLPNFYLRTVVCPLVLLNALAIATHMIPLKSGERISSCLALVLGVTVFQIVIADILPKTSQPTGEPIIIGYSVSSFVLLVFVTISSIVCTNISTKPWSINNRFAKWLLLDALPTVTLVKNIKCRKRTLAERGRPTYSFSYTDRIIPAFTFCFVLFLFSFRFRFLLLFLLLLLLLLLLYWK